MNISKSIHVFSQRRE